jgi:hypothetical protein
MLMISPRETYRKSFSSTFINAISKSSFILFATTLSLFIYACNPQHTGLNDDGLIIDKKTMASIIADIKIIDASRQTGIAPSAYLSTIHVHTDSAAKSKTDTLHNQYLSQHPEYAALIAVDDGQHDFPEEQNPIQRAASLAKPIQEKMTTIFRSHAGADYEFVFQKHRTSREAFEKSLRYYSLKQEVLFQICEEALILLQLQQVNQWDTPPDNTPESPHLNTSE